MSSTIKGNQKHLTGEEREYIEAALMKNLNFKEIAKFLSKDPTTISKEIKKRRIKQEPNFFNNPNKNQCVYRKTCTKTNICNLPDKNCRFPCRQCENCNFYCVEFKKDICKYTQKAPFVCNGCEFKSSCRLEKYYYRANKSHNQYTEILTSAREGINLTEDELANLDELVSPLVKRGQSIAHIFSKHHKEIPCCERTLYNYTEDNLLSICNIDLPRKVRYKKRKSKVKKEPKNINIRENRTYQDFLLFIAENPELSVVEMDTVEGIKGGKVLLTMLFRNSRFMLAFLLCDKTEKAVIDVFNNLYLLLGADLFNKIFAVILTDNGAEFLDPFSLEYDANQNQRLRLFYCDPNCSYQKGMLEKNHEFIRYIVPKGISFDNFNDDDIMLMLNHINSLTRDSLNSNCPFDVAKMLLPIATMELLKMSRIEHDEVLLKPLLLKKAK